MLDFGTKWLIANVHVEEESTGEDGADEDRVTSEDSVVDGGSERLTKS